MADMRDGIRPWEMIQGGFGQLGQAYQGYRQEQEMNRPLDPASQQIIQSILNDPAYGGPGSQPQAPQAPSMFNGQAQSQDINFAPQVNLGPTMPGQGPAPSVPMIGAEQLTEPYQMPGTEPRAQPPAPRGARIDPLAAPPRPQPQAPQGPGVPQLPGGRQYTQRDLRAITQLAPLIQSREASRRSIYGIDVRAQLADMLEGGRNTRANQANELRKAEVAQRMGMSVDQLNARIAMHQQDLALGYQKLNAIQAALGQKTDNTARAAMLQELNTLLDYVGQVESSGMAASDPNLRMDLEGMKRKAAGLTSQLRDIGIGSTGGGQPAPRPATTMIGPKPTGNTAPKGGLVKGPDGKWRRQ